jgi:hypothetical protein
MGRLNWSMKACGIVLLWAATAAILPAQTTKNAASVPTFTTLLNFDGTNGAYPRASPATCRLP